MGSAPRSPRGMATASPSPRPSPHPIPSPSPPNSTSPSTLEVWRRPHVRVAETALRTLSRELSRRLGQWHFLARCIREDRLAKGVLHARLASEAWVRWRAFITLPSRYDRLLSPLRRAALLPPPILPLGKSAAQGHVDTFAASLRPLRPPRTPFKLGSRPSLHRRRASSTSSAV